jgi:hypothetical protein
MKASHISYKINVYTYSEIDFYFDIQTKEQKIICCCTPKNNKS